MRIFYTSITVITLSGCSIFSATQPGGEPAPLATHSHKIESTVTDCRQRIADNETAEGPELDSTSISMLSWNIKKGQRTHWQDDFSVFSMDKDLVLIQEAALQSDLTGALTDNFYWAFGPGYRTRQSLTGVMTLSSSRPITHCNLISWEPWLHTPKATTITEYGLTRTDQTLVVVNFHAVNFTFGIAGYQAQINQIHQILADHQGPIIFSGDFNTWRKKRTQILEAMTLDLGLHSLSFKEDHRTRVFGNQVDHIYVGRLTAGSTATHPVETSDHNPLTAELRM